VTRLDWLLLPHSVSVEDSRNAPGVLCVVRGPVCHARGRLGRRRLCAAAAPGWCRS